MQPLSGGNVSVGVRNPLVRDLRRWNLFVSSGNRLHVLCGRKVPERLRNERVCGVQCWLVRLRVGCRIMPGLPCGVLCQRDTGQQLQPVRGGQIRVRGRLHRMLRVFFAGFHWPERALRVRQHVDWSLSLHSMPARDHVDE